MPCAIALSVGSPPRVRGKVQEGTENIDRTRITPACAGKRAEQAAQYVTYGDHPRVCGEKSISLTFFSRLKGSPPRVRGKEIVFYRPPIAFRITPACAGKSLPATGCRQGLRDHPRVCGEKPEFMRSLSQGAGSPPRVRGKDDRRRMPAGEQRITPACAGKRLKRSHSIGHFSCILCLFHSVLHRASVSGGSRAGPCAPPCLPAQNAVPV